MGKLAVYKYITMMFLVIQIVLSIFTFVGLFGASFRQYGKSHADICIATSYSCKCRHTDILAS